MLVKIPEPTPAIIAAPITAASVNSSVFTGRSYISDCIWFHILDFVEPPCIITFSGIIPDVDNDLRISFISRVMPSIKALAIQLLSWAKARPASTPLASGFHLGEAALARKGRNTRPLEPAAVSSTNLFKSS